MFDQQRSNTLKHIQFGSLPPRKIDPSCCILNNTMNYIIFPKRENLTVYITFYILKKEYA